MGNNITALLGGNYETIEEAKSDLMPGEVIVTDNNESFHIIQSDVFSEIQPLNYRIVVEK